MIVPPEYAGKTRFQGFDDVHPFMLHEITELDFIRLLWILYPEYVVPHISAILHVTPQAQ